MKNSSSDGYHLISICCGTLLLLLEPSLSQQIRFIRSDAEGITSFKRLEIDLSGLGNGNDFYDYDTIDVEVNEFDPPHTFRRVQGSSKNKLNFVGETDDGKLVLNLLRYTGSDLKEVTVGTMTDLSLNKYYQISPSITGESKVIINDVNDIREDFEDEIVAPPEVDDRRRESIVKPFLDSAREYLVGQKQLMVNYSEDDADDLPVVSVLVAWTMKAECNLNELKFPCIVDTTTENNMRALIDLAVAETNTAFMLSGIRGKLELAYAYREESYVEIDNYLGFKYALEALSRRNDGIIDHIHDLRDQYEADVVVLLIHNLHFCGVGYVGPMVASMFSVTAWDCATGAYVFGHEIGHNLGCNHDRGTDNACLKWITGDNFGYRDPQGRFRDIMSYNCKTGQCDGNPGGGCPIVQRFSNLELYHDQPIGDKDNNCARKINSVMDRVSKFYPYEDPCPSWVRRFNFCWLYDIYDFFRRDLFSMMVIELSKSLEYDKLVVSNK